MTHPFHIGQRVRSRHDGSIHIVSHRHTAWTTWATTPLYYVSVEGADDTLHPVDLFAPLSED